MRIGKKLGRRVSALIGVVVAIMLAGCEGSDPLVSAAQFNSLATLGLGASAPFSSDGGNESFAEATGLALESDGSSAIRAEIAFAEDVDVYDIGPVLGGDRITLDVAATGGLDAVAAVFDENAGLFYLNDDRDFFARLVDPRLDFIVPRDVKRLYVVVASSPSLKSSGDYVMAVNVDAGVEVVTLNAQRVLLNFDGAPSVGFGGRPSVRIPNFDAGDMAESLRGRTDELIDMVMAEIRRDYAGLNVEIFSSRDGDAPAGDVSTVHFGSFDRALLGVAENIDEFNEKTVQDAIIFTDTFDVFAVLDPSIEEYAQALANVTSHEIGHLLGLVHTRDALGIMDISASLRGLMRDQSFSRSPLDAATFPVGFQDAPRTLIDSVGGEIDVVRESTASQRASAKILPSDDHDASTDSVFVRPVLSSCGQGRTHAASP
jgi:hypothetical protein